MEKLGRNDPCPCGSGKKFKKCCELKQAHKKKIKAEMISGSSLSQETQETSKVSSFFFKKITPSTPPEQESPKLDL